MLRKVEVVPYNLEWERIFEKERTEMLAGISLLSMKVHHIGSTSVPGLSAKPIIDLLGEVEDIELLDRKREEFARLGYIAQGENGIEGRRFFIKKNKQGERTCHVHVFAKESSEIARHLTFRNYLREHPQEAERYQAVKIAAAEKFPFDIESYMDYKNSIIQEIEQRAFEWCNHKNKGKSSVVAKNLNEGNF